MSAAIFKKNVTINMSFFLLFTDLGMNYPLFFSIKELGKNLCSIHLLVVMEDMSLDVYKKPMIDFIIEGCPKLKSLTLESLRGWRKWKESLAIHMPQISEVYKENPEMAEMFNKLGDLTLTEENLKALQKGCRELKVLNLTKVGFKGISTENEIKKILPDCNVEIKECHLEDEDEELSLYSSDSDNQESNAEGASEESDDSDDLPPLETC